MKQKIICSIIFVTIPVWGPPYIVWQICVELWDVVTEFYEEHLTK